MVSIAHVGYALFIVGVVATLISYQQHDDVWGRYRGWSVSRFWLIFTIIALGIVGYAYLP